MRENTTNHGGTGVPARPVERSSTSLLRQRNSGASLRRTGADAVPPQFVVLLVDAAGEETSVYRQQVTGDEAGRIGCQEYSGAAEFVELSEPPHGRAQEKFAAAVGSVEQGGVQVGAKDPGSNRIYANARLMPIQWRETWSGTQPPPCWRCTRRPHKEPRTRTAKRY